MLTLPATVALVVGVATMTAPRKYRASAAFMPQEPNSSVGNVSQIAAQFGLAAPRSTGGSPQFYADLLTSKELLRHVALTEYKTPTHSGNLMSYFEMERESGNGALLKTIKRIQESVSVQPNRLTGVVRAEVVTKDPVLSEHIVTRMLELLNDYNLRRRQSQARAEREFVHGRLREAAADLAIAEKALADFRSTNRILASPYLQSRAEQLERQIMLRQELYTTLSGNFEAAKIDEVRSTPVLTVLESPNGLVEPVRRYAVRKGIIAAAVAGAVAVLFALVHEYVRRARAGSNQDFHDVSRMLVQTRLAFPIRVLRRGEPAR